MNETPSQPAQSDSIPPLRSIGVLAAVDPDDRMTRIDAEVVRRQLEARLGPCHIVLRTSVRSVLPLRHSPWPSTPPHGWASEVDVVVVDERLDDAARHRAGLTRDTPVVTTSLWADEPLIAALFAATVDPAALDARGRMLEHLAITGDDLDDGRLALTATDLYLLAQRGHIDTDDARVDALLAGPTAACDTIQHEFDRVADSIAVLAEPRSPSATADLVHQLAEERRNRLLDERLAADRLDEMQRQLDRLRDQLESTELRHALTPQPDTPGESA